MAEEWIGIIGLLAFALIICLMARHQNREADKQGGRNKVQFRFGFVRNRFKKEPEELYTKDRKINREWKR